jgi:acetyl esterase
MPVDPQFAPFLVLMAQMPPLESMTPEQVRGMRGLMSEAARPVAELRDLMAGDVPVRLYRSRVGGVLPVLLYFHGGGFVLGDIASHDALCRDLCAGADCAVLAVEYRLAPEHKFPAATDDCLAALVWAAAHAAELGIDPARIAVGGDSAGGNLATVTALRARDAGGPPLVGQALIYPVTDHYSRPTASVRANAEGPILTLGAMRWFADHYLNAANIAHPWAAPLQAPDLSALPPALVITAEYDPLCDEGEAYAARLRVAGVPTLAVRYGGAVHGFLSFAGVPLAHAAVAQTCLWLRERFAVEAPNS